LALWTDAAGIEDSISETFIWHLLSTLSDKSPVLT
jgi:hypothetical protein